MSTSVDSRITTMKFDNKQFESGASKTLGTLGKLKSSLSGMTGSSKGLNDVNAAASRFSLKGMSDGVSGISGKFLALSTVAITALANITNRAVDAGLKLTKSLTLEPIMDGFHEYETNMNSIQTVLANTRDKGSTLKDVNEALYQLNAYSDKTIYNFSEMAKNIGTFTAAGVDLKTSVNAIKGIANLAAISGSNSEQASTAMYQLSQAISAGKVGLQDWNSVVNAGMGGAVFQKALAQTAVAMGDLDKSQVTTSGSMKKLTIAGESFRESISSKPGHNSWLSSDVLVNTLKQFSGDISDAELKTMGFKDTQIKAIREMGQAGIDAATKVKTVSQLMGTLKESVGSGWAQTFQIVLGDFNEAKTLFTSVSNILGGMIGQSSKARNKILGDWKKLGGRDVLIESIGNLFTALVNIIKPIHDAFRDIFPRKTGKELFDLTVMFRDFTEKLIIGKKGADNLRGTFRGIFGILGIGVEVIKGVVHYFSSLAFLIVSKLLPGTTEFSGGIGEMIGKLYDWIKTGDKIKALFDFVIKSRDSLYGPILEFIGSIIGAFGLLIKSGPDAFFDRLKNSFKLLLPVVDIFKNLLNKVTDAFHIAVDSAGGFGGAIKNALSSVMSSVSGFLGGFHIDFASIFNMGDSVSAAEAGVHGVGYALGAVVFAAKKVADSWGAIVDIFRQVGHFLAPIWDLIKEIFSGFKEKTVEFVNNLGFNEGLAIVNTGFFIAFYRMLKKFLGGMKDLIESVGGSFDSLKGIFDQTTKNLKTMQNSVRADMIFKIAAALALLAVSLLILSKIDVKTLGISLGALGAMMAMLVGALGKLDKDGNTLKSTAQVAILTTSLVGLSAAMLVMAAAIAILGNMDAKTIVKGLVAIAAILAMTTKVILLLGNEGAGQLVIASAALVILSVALIGMAGALKLFSSMDTKTLLDGALKVVGVLVVMSAMMAMMPSEGMIAAAGALWIMANALIVLAGALKLMGLLSGGEIVKAILTLAFLLPILGAAMNSMVETVTGSAAMLVMAFALQVLAVALALLGSLPLKVIGVALLAMIGVFAVLGIASALLTPVIPIIYLLAGAIGLLGLAALAVGGGVLMLSAGLAALAVSGAAGVAVLTAAVIGIAELLPLIMQQFGLGVIAFAKVIKTAGPPLVGAFTTLLLSLLKAVIKITPQLGKALIVLLTQALKVIVVMIPKFISAGYKILIAFLNGIANNIGKVADAVTKIITKFLGALARNLPKIVDAGFKFIIKFINGVTKAINDNVDALTDAGVNLAKAIVNGMIKGLSKAGGAAVEAAKNVAGNMLHAAMKKLGIASPSKEFAKVGMYSAQGLAVGIEKHSNVAETAAAGMADNALGVITATMSRIPDAIAGSLDTNPVITPILDLTRMANDASKIGTMLDSNPMTADVSYGQASSISADQMAAAEAASQAGAPTGITEVKFEQTNISPEPLSDVVIYRQTKNQLSMAKEALKIR